MDSEQPYYRNLPWKSLCAIDGTNEDENVSWDQLPTDLLRSIADRLGIVELLRFRCVCKDWYSASSSSSAQIECSSEPWFLLYGETSKNVLYKDSSEKYHLNVPELEDGATCIASEKGWLLVLKNASIYFFCPFSGAKLMLPELPINDYNCTYLAAFSSLPTSPDCKVCFFKQVKSSDSYELYVLVRGATSWTKQILNSVKRADFKTIRAASFQGDEVYLMDETDKLIIYNFMKKEVQLFQIVARKPGCANAGGMPFCTGRNHVVATKIVEHLELNGRFSLTTCGTRSPMTQRSETDTVVFGESINGFQFHEDDGEEQDSTRNIKGVWIHPRFFQVSPSYQW